MHGIISETRNLEVDLPYTISNTSLSFQRIFTTAFRAVQSAPHQGKKSSLLCFIATERGASLAGI